MKKTILTAIFIFIAGTALADNNVKRPLKKVKRTYKSVNGMHYEYDLSKPHDRAMYEVDPQAQLRDEVNVDPRIRSDRLRGYYGGGVYRGEGKKK